MDVKGEFYKKWSTCKNMTCKNDDISKPGAISNCLMCSSWMAEPKAWVNRPMSVYEVNLPSRWG